MEATFKEADSSKDVNVDFAACLESKLILKSPLQRFLDLIVA